MSNGTKFFDFRTQVCVLILDEILDTSRLFGDFGLVGIRDSSMVTQYARNQGNPGSIPTSGVRFFAVMLVLALDVASTDPNACRVLVLASDVAVVENGVSTICLTYGRGLDQ